MNGQAVLATMIVAGAVLALAGWVTWREARTARALWQRYRAIVDTPTTAIRNLSPGVREVRGTVTAAGEPLVSPMSNTPCVYYRFQAWDERPETEERDGKTVHTTVMALVINDTRQVPCVVDDGTGQAALALDGAELVLEPKARLTTGFFSGLTDELRQTVEQRYRVQTTGLLFTRKMRFEETVIAHGGPLYVLGSCSRDKDQRPRLGRGRSLFLVGDAPEQSLAFTFARRALFAAMRATLFASGGLAAAVVVVRWAVVANAG